MQTSACHWLWCHTNWKYHFSPRYFSGIKTVTVFKIFEETMPKLSVNFENLSHKTLTRTNIPVPYEILVFLHHNTVTNVDQICCWSAHIFLIGNTHRGCRIICAIMMMLQLMLDWCSAWLFGTSYTVKTPVLN